MKVFANKWMLLVVAVLAAVLGMGIDEVAALSEQAKLRSVLYSKLKHTHLLESVAGIQVILNLHDRQAAMTQFASGLSLEELNYLVDSNVWDTVFASAKDWVVGAGNTVGGWATRTAGEIAEAFKSDVCSPVAGWTAKAVSDTKTWTKGVSKATKDELNSFFNDVKQAYDTVEDEVLEQYTKAANFVDKADEYLTGGGFENDVKRIGQKMKDAIGEVCEIPGVEIAMEVALSAALKAAVCTATSMNAPGCKTIPPIVANKIPKKLANKLVTALQAQVVKCAIFEVLEESSPLCPGLNDYLADFIVNIFTGSVYDVAAQAIVACICNDCPGTCGYNNRQLCTGKWWVTQSTQLIEKFAPDTLPGVPVPASLDTFRGATIISAWYGQGMGRGGMDVTSHVIRRLAETTYDSDQFTINNDEVGLDPTPNVAKAFFVKFRLDQERPGQEFLYYDGPKVNEGYVVNLAHIRAASWVPYPGTIISTDPSKAGRSARIVMAHWNNFDKADGRPAKLNSEVLASPNINDLPLHGFEVTASVFYLAAASSQKSVALNPAVFGGPPNAQSVNYMFLLVELNNGFGWSKQTDLVILKSGDTITYEKLNRRPVISEAWYGRSADYATRSTGLGKDVTQLVRTGLFMSDSFQASNKNLGGDPNPNNPKNLYITYSAYGVSSTTLVVGEMMFVRANGFRFEASTVNSVFSRTTP